MNNLNDSQDIDARRERDNKITKVMGSYLLKGYTLLEDICDKCQTPLMRPRGAIESYCVCCHEIDVPAKENKTPIPIFPNHQASSSEMSCKGFTDSCCQVEDEQGEKFSTSSLSDNRISATNELNRSYFIDDCELSKDIRRTKLVLQKKLNWATTKLDQCNSVNTCIELCSLIKLCSETLNTISNFK